MTKTSQKFVKVLSTTLFTQLEKIFLWSAFSVVLGEISLEMYIFFILSRPLTTKTSETQKWCASKILRILSLDFGKMSNIGLSSNQNDAFSSSFSAFLNAIFLGEKNSFTKNFTCF